MKTVIRKIAELIAEAIDTHEKVIVSTGYSAGQSGANCEASGFDIGMLILCRLTKPNRVASPQFQVATPST